MVCSASAPFTSRSVDGAFLLVTSDAELRGLVVGVEDLVGLMAGLEGAAVGAAAPQPVTMNAVTVTANPAKRPRCSSMAPIVVAYSVGRSESAAKTNGGGVLGWLGCMSERAYW